MHILNRDRTTRVPISRGALRTWWIAAALIVVVAMATGWFALRAYDRPLGMNAERVEVRVVPGVSARGVARALQAAGVEINADAFVAVARATKATQSLRAGRYEIERGLSLRGLIDKLRRGEVLRERFTIVEGWTFDEMRRALAQVAYLKPDSAKLATAELLRAVGANETHPEGLFAPETYVFDPDSSDLDVLRQAYRLQQSRLGKAWEGRSETLPYKSPYEALIMASIVEKETGRAEERGMIAGVFVNRQKLGMLLQTDPTVIYGLGERFDGNLRKRDLLADGPYNTYTRVGLPPTPIALPGKSAIAAALNPDSTKALYFVARGDGSSQFSESLAEHNRAVDRYQRGIR